jgi:hypothetical protein
MENRDRNRSGSEVRNRLYLYRRLDKEFTISARLWKSRPCRHFALRWKRTKYPEMGLEIASRLDAIQNGGEISDLTMEGFLYNNKVWMAIIDTRRLYTAIDGIVPFLSEFTVENTGPGDLTIFKRASWDLYGKMGRSSGLSYPYEPSLDLIYDFHAICSKFLL